MRNNKKANKCYSHCIEYLRQVVQCTSDTTLEGFDTTHPNKFATTGWGSTYVFAAPIEAGRFFCVFYRKKKNTKRLADSFFASDMYAKTSTLSLLGLNRTLPSTRGSPHTGNCIHIAG